MSLFRFKGFSPDLGPTVIIKLHMSEGPVRTIVTRYSIKRSGEAGYLFKDCQLNFSHLLPCSTART